MSAQILNFSLKEGKMRKERILNEKNVVKTKQERHIGLLNYFKASMKKSNYDLENFLLSDIWQIYNETKDEGPQFGLEAIRFAKQELTRSHRLFEALKYLEMCIVAFNEFLIPLQAAKNPVREIFLDFLKLGGSCGSNDVVVREAILVLMNKKKKYEAEKCLNAYRSLQKEEERTESIEIAKNPRHKGQAEKHAEMMLDFKIQCFGRASAEEIVSLFFDVCIKSEKKEEAVREAIQTLRESNKKYLAKDCEDFFVRIKKSEKVRPEQKYWGTNEL